jgi:hypothetical protein
LSSGAQQKHQGFFPNVLFEKGKQVGLWRKLMMMSSSIRRRKTGKNFKLAFYPLKEMKYLLELLTLLAVM